MESFPNNPVFERWRGRIAAREKETALVDSIFKDVLNKAEKNFEGYNTPMVRREANYYLGYNLKNDGDLNSALHISKNVLKSQRKLMKRVKNQVSDKCNSLLGNNF